MWRQKRKSVQELKLSAGLPIEADESVLMWEEWKGKKIWKAQMLHIFQISQPNI